MNSGTQRRGGNLSFQENGMCVVSAFSGNKASRPAQCIIVGLGNKDFARISPRISCHIGDSMTMSAAGRLGNQ